MNISKSEQRVLHVMELGGKISHVRGDNGKIIKVICYTREGYVLSDCTYDVFQRLKRRKMISSKKGQAYRITRLGITSVRSQLNQR